MFPFATADPLAREASDRARRRWMCALGGAAVLALGLRVAAVYSVAGNWDEFGLFESASRTAETGVLVSGGRPGLAQLLVLPLVAHCTDELAVVRSARLLWVFFTFAYLAGVAVLCAQLNPDPRRRRGDALLAVALLGLVPAFLEWSVQVRTDQIALAGGVWGGVALLASRRRAGWAALSGLLFALGFLSSQKLVYVAAAMVLLAVGQSWLAREFRPRREAIRGALCAALFVAAIFGYRAVAASQQIDVSGNAAAVSGISSEVVRGGLSAFDFYRNTIGYSQYVALAPTLAPHFALFAALVAATLFGRRSAPGRRVLALAWALIGLGIAVGLFHAAAFAYFWMTLGLFPALAFALARGPIASLLPPTGPVRTAAIAGFWALLALPGIAAMVQLLEDTQAVQRQSFEFVHRNFAPTDAGFHPESGLFCRGDAQPVRHFYSRDIYESFGRPGSEARTQRLIDQFRREPIRFVVQSFRLNQFPIEVRRFWVENYQPYKASVFVAGHQLAGRAGQRRAFEVLAPGPYRWIPESGRHAISIDGVALGPDDVVNLERGDHRADFAEDVPGGMLVLALADPPGPAPAAFYKHYR